MTSTANKNISLPVQGVTSLWGDALNNGAFTDIDTCLGGSVSKALTNTNVTLSAAESKAAILQLTGALTGNVQITTVTNGFCLVRNATTGSYLVTFTNGVGAIALIPQGISTMVHIDASGGVFLAGARHCTVGQVAPFIGVSPSGGWLECDGSLISRSSYPALWTYANASGNIVSDALWSSSQAWGCFSTGDASTTFRLPDLRGLYVIPWAHTRTGLVDTGRSAGIFQDQAMLPHTHSGGTGAENSQHVHFTSSGGAASVSYGGGVDVVRYVTGTPSSVENDIHGHNFTTNSGDVLSGIRNVPQNMALMYCISYL